MSKKTRFKLNLRGLNALMRSEEMQGVLDQHARRIAAAAGDGYEAESAHPIRYIAIASVGAQTRAAQRDNFKHNTLVKMIGGGS